LRLTIFTVKMANPAKCLNRQAAVNVKNRPASRSRSLGEGNTGRTFVVALAPGWRVKHIEGLYSHEAHTAKISPASNGEDPGFLRLADNAFSFEVPHAEKCSTSGLTAVVWGG